jgi:hypothetical protein
MTERRRHTRYPFERELEVRAPDPLGHLLVRANDISASGFSFVSDLELQVGDVLILGSEGDGFLVRATVRNVRPANGGFVVGAERHL